MNANYASVKQQAGIFAGDEGYDIDIANHSDLKAGLVTSTDKAEAEGKNRFSTGTLNATNLENHADYKGSAVGVSAAGDYKGGWNGQRVDKEGKPTHSVSNVVGYGKDQDSQSSRTTSGINTQNLIIRDEKGQLNKTAKTAAQIKEDIKTDITTETAESRSGKLENNFDKDKLQKELDYQVKALSDFQTTTVSTINEKMANHAESKRAEAEQAKAAGNTTKARELEQEAEKWETGGAYRQGVDAVTNAVGLALGGSPTAGVIAVAASPYINTQIKQETEGNEAANLMAHALWGAVEAYTQGGKAGAGAAAAVTGEVGAKLISEQVFGKSPENLTEAEKRTVSELSQVAAGLAGGLSASGGNSLSTAQAVKTGQGIGKSAVENNYLTAQQIKFWLNAYDKANSENKEMELISNLDKVDHRQTEQALETRITKEQLAREETALRALLEDPTCLERCQSLAVYSINQLQHLQQDYDGLLENKAINAGIGFTMGYGALGAGKVALKLPAVQNYLGSLPYKDKFLGASLSMGSNASYQQYKYGEIKASDVLWAGGTAFASSGTSFIKMNTINAGSAATKAYLEGEDPAIAGVASLITSSLGYVGGKFIESGSSRIMNRDYYKDKTKFNYVPIKHPDHQYISKYRQLSSVPTIFGNAGDNILSGVTEDKSKALLEQYKNKKDDK